MLNVLYAAFISMADFPIKDLDLERYFLTLMPLQIMQLCDICRITLIFVKKWILNSASAGVSVAIYVLRRVR